jgi:very-short-patch-repair endonuclease
MKNNKKWICNNCNQQFETRSKLVQHRRESLCYHKKNYYFECSCDFCGRNFNTKESKTLHEKCCQNNPNRIPGKSHPYPERLKIIQSERMKKEYAEGKRYSGWNKRHDKVPSFAEEWLMGIIANELIDKNYQYDTIRMNNYTLDFTWSAKQLCIEIDGEQHYNNPKRMESDIKKDQLIKINGWQLLRLRWSWVITHKQEAVIKIKDFIDNGILIPIDKQWKSKKELYVEKIKLRGPRTYHGGYKLTNNKVNERKNLILNSGIDFTKWGWMVKLSKLLNLSHTQIRRFVKEYMPEIYKT